MFSPVIACSFGATAPNAFLEFRPKIGNVHSCALCLKISEPFLNEKANELRHGSGVPSAFRPKPHRFSFLFYLAGGILFKKVWRWGFGRVSQVEL
jgi:hypothetical protein